MDFSVFDEGTSTEIRHVGAWKGWSLPLDPLALSFTGPSGKRGSRQETLCSETLWKADTLIQVTWAT